MKKMKYIEGYILQFYINGERYEMEFETKKELDDYIEDNDILDEDICGVTVQTILIEKNKHKD